MKAWGSLKCSGSTFSCFFKLVSFDRSKNTGTIDVIMDGFALEEK